MLRADGHDVAAVRDRCAGARDADVLALARAERRILLTEDKDFGELALRAADPPGTVLFRDLGGSLDDSLQAFRSLLERHSTDLARSFVVIRGSRIRRRQLG